MSYNDIENKPHLRLGVYEHYKGTLYLVTGLGFHTESNEWCVFYEKLGDTTNTVFIRPFSMFIEIADGVERFKFRPEIIKMVTSGYIGT